MDKLKCIIVDDEPLARDGLSILVDEVDFIEVEASFENAILAGGYVNSHSVDLMFLDIEMPGLSGLEFIRSLKTAPLIILTTAYPQFALEAFELDVIDYLLKPIRFDRFYKSVIKVQELVRMKKQGISEISSVTEDHFFIKSERKYIKLFYDEIRYIKGLKDYVVIHTAKQKYMTAMNVKTIHRQLPEDKFFRTSKSHIINTDKIESVEIDCVWLGQDEIPLGNTYKEAFMNTHVAKKLIKR